MVYIAIAAAVAVVVLFVQKAGPVITLFGVSAAIAYIINPLVDRLSSKRVPRIVAIIFVFALFTGACVGAAAAIAPVLARQFQELIHNLPDYFQSLAQLWERAVALLRDTELPEAAKDIPANMGRNLQKVGMAAGKKVGGGVMGFLSQLPSVALVPILVYYFLNDGAKFRRGFVAALPPASRDTAGGLLDRLNKALGGYIRGQMKLCLLMGVLSWLAMTIIGVKYSLVFGVIAGVTEFIPYLGPLLGIIGPVVFALFTSPVMLLKVGVAFVILQVLETLAAPRVVSGDVGMHPALVLFILMAGGQVAGLGGMIAALPAAVVLKTLFDFFYMERYLGALEKP